MGDVFQQGPKFSGKVFTAANFKMTFGGRGDLSGAGAMVQSANLRYAQNVNVIRELTSELIYYVVALPQGAASFRRFVTDANGIKIIAAMSDPCNAGDISFEYQRNARCGGNGEPLDLKAKSAYCNAVNYSVSVADYNLAEDASFVFASLESSAV